MIKFFSKIFSRENKVVEEDAAIVNALKTGLTESREKVLEGIVPQEMALDEMSLNHGGSSAQHSAVNKELSNDVIRGHITEMLQESHNLPLHLVELVSLSCHPWPDTPLSDEGAKALIAEMLPCFTMQHSNPLEVAADRLLRLAESTSFTLDKEVSLQFQSAAAAIQNYIITSETKNFTDSLSSPSAVIGNPLALPILGAQYDGEQSQESSAIESFNWHDVVFQLLGAGAKHRTRDLGVLSSGLAVGVTVDQLANHLGVRLPSKGFDTYIDGLDSRERDILTKRIFTFDSKPTLEELGEKWGITRERVRQIEVKIKKKVERKFETTISELTKNNFEEAAPFVLPKMEFQELCYSFASDSRFKSTLAAFIGDQQVSWRENRWWYGHTDSSELIEQFKDSIQNHTDEYGIIDIDNIQVSCFRTVEEKHQFLIEEIGAVNFLNYWIAKDTLKCRVAAALKSIGRPATKEELSVLLDHPTANIGSTFAATGIVRADRYRWGFPEWITDEYDGIAGEIEQRIDEYHGEVPVRILLDEIPKMFDVAESSVKAYLSSDAFVVQDDMVRRSDGTEYTPKLPVENDNAILIDGIWGEKYLLADRHFEGHSLAVHYDIAYANGIRPGDSLSVPVEGANHIASAIWRLQNLNRKIDVGRVSEYLLSQNFKAGDTVVVLATPNSVSIIPVPVLLAGIHGTTDEVELPTVSENDPLLKFL